jgi:hypothetical protein
VPAICEYINAPVSNKSPGDLREGRRSRLPLTFYHDAHVDAFAAELIPRDEA